MTQGTLKISLERVLVVATYTTIKLNEMTAVRSTATESDVAITFRVSYEFSYEETYRRQSKDWTCAQYERHKHIMSLVKKARTTISRWLKETPIDGDVTLESFVRFFFAKNRLQFMWPFFVGPAWRDFLDRIRPDPVTGKLRAYSLTAEQRTALREAGMDMTHARNRKRVADASVQDNTARVDESIESRKRKLNAIERAEEEARNDGWARSNEDEPRRDTVPVDTAGSADQPTIATENRNAVVVPTVEMATRERAEPPVLVEGAEPAQQPRLLLDDWDCKFERCLLAGSKDPEEAARLIKQRRVAIGERARERAECEQRERERSKYTQREWAAKKSRELDEWIESQRKLRPPPKRDASGGRGVYKHNEPHHVRMIIPSIFTSACGVCVMLGTC
jgi:hypothetical protein